LSVHNKTEDIVSAAFILCSSQTHCTKLEFKNFLFRKLKMNAAKRNV